MPVAGETPPESSESPDESSAVASSTRESVDVVISAEVLHTFVGMDEMSNQLPDDMRATINTAYAIIPIYRDINELKPVRQSDEEIESMMSESQQALAELKESQFTNELNSFIEHVSVLLKSLRRLIKERSMVCSDGIRRSGCFR